jgi:hypothetical protein
MISANHGREKEELSPLLFFLSVAMFKRKAKVKRRTGVQHSWNLMSSHECYRWMRGLAKEP